ncbi:MAG: hypothetical protein H6633_09585 [Anaerolineales bacterium]|nr:hypothetical protein [Anaerolineales bacterium]
MKKRSEEGKHLLKQQSYTVKSAVGDGDQVAVEAEWVGVLAIPLGNLPVGYEMRAYFAMFFEFKTVVLPFSGIMIALNRGKNSLVFH